MASMLTRYHSKTSPVSESNKLKKSKDGKIQKKKSTKSELGRLLQSFGNLEKMEDAHDRQAKYKSLVDDPDTDDQRRQQMYQYRAESEKKCVLQWYEAQKKRTMDDFNYARLHARHTIEQNLLGKIAQLKEEVDYFDKLYAK